MNCREVKCSDRLPDSTGHYYTDHGELYFWKDGGSWSDETGERWPWFWLEPYELPTEEKIKNEFTAQIGFRGGVEWQSLRDMKIVIDSAVASFFNLLNNNL